MKNKFSIIVLFLISSFLFFGDSIYAEQLTPQLCKEKAIAAAKLFKEKGEESFPALQDPDGEFRFGEGSGYVWVQTVDGVTLSHLIPSLVGKDQIGMQDSNGMYFFLAFKEIVLAYKQGWVEYWWPKPNENESSPKISFVILVERSGVKYLVGSGMYGITGEEIKSIFPDDPVYDPDDPIYEDIF